MGLPEIASTPSTKRPANSSGRARRAHLPQDNTFSHPWLSFLNGKRVLYSAAGDSSLICLNARTGEPLWRTPVAKAGAKGGINAAVLEYKGNIIVVHESENIDTSDVGRMAAFKIPAEIKPPSPADAASL